jgi:hypothetical protein
MRVRMFIMVLICELGLSHTVRAQSALQLSLSPQPPTLIFTPSTDKCDGSDVPDAPLRAFKNAQGHTVAFGMHYTNRSLKGATLHTLKLDCTITLPSKSNSNPASYDDKSWIAATTTSDGQTIHALVHHEFQANHHKGRCTFKDYMSCWTNSVVSATSTNGGASFTRATPPTVVATYPFKQDVGQGRHRGFFNPSNIVSDGVFFYTFMSTTGWQAQDHGVCLFRTATPHDATSWRAFDGVGFTIRYGDPYRKAKPPKNTCYPIKPFPTPVGSVSKHRPSGQWIAVFQAKADGGIFPVSGFYSANSPNLLNWSTPRLIMSGKTLYDDPCTTGGSLISYPSLLDSDARTRNYEDVSDKAYLFYMRMKVNGCSHTSERDLWRQEVNVFVGR